MNSWINVSYIVVILSAQDYFGVGPVSGTELTPEQGKDVYDAVFNLYRNVEHKLTRNKGIQIVGLADWSKTIDKTKSYDHQNYVTWAKNGATIISNAVLVGQKNEFNDRINKTKKTIAEKIPEDAATAINSVLEELKNNLNTPQPKGNVNTSENAGNQENDSDGGRGCCG